MSLFRSFNPALKDVVFQSLKKTAVKSFVTPYDCQLIMDKLDLKTKYPQSENLTIVEIFSGFSLLSTMLNYELQPRKHILVEHNKPCKAHYETVFEALEKSGQRNSFIHYDHDGYSWKTSTQMIQDKLVDVPTQPRDKIHDQLLVVGNLYYHPFDESLFAQWIMCCGHHNWFQRFGSVKMICIVPEATAQKFMAGPGFSKRNRSALKRDIFTDSKLIAITEIDGDNTMPDGYNYDPNLLIKDQPAVISLDSIHPKNPRVAVIEVNPRPNVDINIDILDYVSQILMYRKNHIIGESLSHLAPGAHEDLAPKLTHLLDKTPKELTAAELQEIVEVFDNWPFKPSVEDRNSLNPEFDDTFM